MTDKLPKPHLASAQYQGKYASPAFTMMGSPAPLCERAEASLEVADEAKKRLAGREILARRLYELIEKEASARKISIRKIVVLPAWSHEYEERTGVVIDVEIEGSTDQRFSLWDAVCEQIGKLEESLPEKESRFLSDDISFVVSRG